MLTAIFLAIVAIYFLIAAITADSNGHIQIAGFYGVGSFGVIIAAIIVAATL